MADRYWVGGSGTWDTSDKVNWSATSGGTGGASAPIDTDDVFFNGASGAAVVSLSSGYCRQLNCTGFTGTLSFGGNVFVTGNVFISPTTTIARASDGMGGLYFNQTAGSYSLTTSGKLMPAIRFGSGATIAVTYNLLDAVTVDQTATFSGAGSGVTINFNGYNVTAGRVIVSNVSNATGQITVTSTTADFQTSASPGVFGNVSFTSGAITTGSIAGTNTFSNVTFAGRTLTGVSSFLIYGNQTINGTLTVSVGANTTCRTFLRSSTLGTTRTLTCAAFSGTDIDFRDITIAGAAAPVSGTRLGDCKGNSGVTFDAAKTVYWNQAGGGNWSTTSWATTSGGTPAVNNFPLAQDTAVVQSTGLNSGNFITINAPYNIGTIDMSARTSNTMTLATGTTTPAIYGNWINGTGTTLTGTGTLTFAGRGSQTITSAGKTFTQPITINNPGGFVSLQDAFVSNFGVTLQAGSFDLSGYNATTPNAVFSLATSKAVNIGSATWTLTTSGTVWNYSGSNLTVTGTGTISLTNASAKTFSGGGISYAGITLNQGGAGALTITGNNTFKTITNTAIGSVLFTGGTTNEFGSFNLNGALGTLLTLGSTNTTQAILKAPSWNVGANSTNAGNNTGLSFSGTGPNYLSVSYINGQLTVPSSYSGGGNFFSFF